MMKIVPNLWFDSEAEEAARFYTSIFKDSEVGQVTRYTEVGPGEPGTVLTVDFVLEGQNFTAINGGPLFKFNEAISLLVNCESQEELDEMWDKLLEGGGQEVQCGWLKDKYGLSWQIVPTEMYDMMKSSDTEAVNRVMKAMLQMVKIDLKVLRDAYNDK